MGAKNGVYDTENGKENRTITRKGEHNLSEAINDKWLRKITSHTTYRVRKRTNISSDVQLGMMNSHKKYD